MDFYGMSSITKQLLLENMKGMEGKKIILIDPEKEYKILCDHFGEGRINHVTNPYKDFSVYYWDEEQKSLYELFADRTRRQVSESISELHEQSRKQPLIVINSIQIEFVRQSLSNKRTSQIVNSSILDFYLCYGLISSEEYLEHTETF